MKKVSSKNYYSNYYASWDWTEPIVERFLDSFTKFDAHQVDFKGQIYVGVYGPTQVGKTTFILNLIGINENRFEELSKALRGKQSIGKSSTVTATLYEKNSDNNFEIIFPTKEKVTCETCEELENILQDFRKKVTTQTYEEMNEMVIKIPKNFFYSNYDKTDNLIIVDLPGDDTKDTSEEKHVEQILNKYLLLCKTVIIMEIGTKINNLFQLSLESMKGWFKDESRFMVVLTRASSNRDIQEKLISGELNTVEETREYYLNDLSRAALDNRGINDFKTPFYFFELGGSLQNIKERNEEIYEKLKVFNNKNFSKLVEQLHKNNLPEFKIKGLKSISTEIEEMKRKNLETLNVKQINVKDNIDNLMSKIEDLDLLNKRYTKVFEDDKKKWEKLKNSNNLDEVLEIIENKYETYEFKKKKMKYGDINGPYQMMILEITPYLKSLEKLIKSNKEIKNSHEIINELSDIVNSEPLSVDFTLFNKVHTYEYYYWVNQLYERILSLQKNLNELIEKNYNYFIKKNINKLKAFSSIKEKNMLEKEKNNLDTIKKRIELAKDEWKVEAEKVSLLEDIFIDEYKKQMNILKGKILDPSLDKNIKPYILMEMNVITNQTERVLNINGN